MTHEDIILSINNLAISFKSFSGRVRALRGVTIDVVRGKTIAIVGESGSGKSVTVKTIMRILSKNEKIESGSIVFNNKRDNEIVPIDLLKLSNKHMQREIKGKKIAMIFQDPMTSLDPTMKIGKQILEAIFAHKKIKLKAAVEQVHQLLETVGIKNIKAVMNAYPYQLSGGMRQRIVIAIAISCEPDLLICDEPTTALDVTIQSKILDLIKKIQKARNLSVIFITHDLGVVSRIADQVYVMYAGKIVEYGTCNDIFYDPRHPYTWGLLESTPDMAYLQERLASIPGTPKRMIGDVKGDQFAERNRYALNIDFRMEPPFFKVNDHHFAATWLLHPKAPQIRIPESLRKRIDLMKEENRNG
ncbi:ABC transporter ATP-binding protein [Sporolactobacillus nakayamae]|uniref:Oligopeptide transport system ATP-binding protein n=1 Tax=Sporolactobacillus nakayamae TaxID=269670 RepID=A0A1I2UWR9_9BACL|nr:ABC transporter ATP-binding protein [Sporolactobacillus nakayamae]SFG79211.1 oligopeptide transport system ATP-binding protein [Sporolactobacillus nakayamae]